MYSMVLMMAMSTSPEAVACPKMLKGHGCTGSTTCTGYVATGCTSYTPMGCTSYVPMGCTGCTGCTGGGHKMFGGGLFKCFKSTTCTGCTGYVPMGCTGCTGVIVTPVTPMPPKEMPKVEPKKGATSAPATIALSVPADAKVTIDGNVTTSTSEARVFVTPTLANDGVYSYTINAEVVREGKKFSTTKVVTVSAGQTTSVELNPVVITTLASR